jgi:hypothetical protein
MPVVTVFAPADVGLGPLLPDLADRVAEALSLGAGDVIAMASPITATATSGSSDAAPWLVVTIAGSDRGSEMMERARTAAEASVRSWAHDSMPRLGGVWTQWQLPMP